ncbi:MAG: GNAT family N-acetyltransferase [Eubacteriales bacterium]|nr:GNAT family N-acetyltransferase [Eubacteriales bacterium]
MIERAHGQWKDVITKRMHALNGRLIKGPGYMLFDAGVPELDAHMRGGVLDKTGDFDAVLSAFPALYDGRREEWALRIVPERTAEAAQILPERGWKLRNPEGSPIMSIETPTNYAKVHVAELVAQNRDGVTLLSAAVPVIAEAFDLSTASAEKLLLHGQYNTNPNARAAVIREAGQVVSAGLMVYTPALRTAGLYYIATRSACRGRGLAKDLVSLLTDTAFELGATAVILQASKLGRFVYEHLGYREIGRYMVWLHPDTGMPTPSVN